MKLKTALQNCCAALLFTGTLLACRDKQAASDNAPSAKAAFTEQHRPQLHFTPPAQWMNDPNGMVYYEGEYHFFYQHYPDSNVWGPMHWGHSITKDLVHWEHLPIALYPDSIGYIFSGSAVVDWNNTSGFGKDGKPPLVAMFTYHNMAAEKAGKKDCETQGIAYSNDRGRNWIKYAANPVMPNLEKDRDFRDPKVVWDQARQQWIAVLAVGNHTEFWRSPDLKNWSFLSDFGREYGIHDGVWECPDLFPMPVVGTAETKWVLIVNLNPGGPNGGSATQYFVGNFDGKQFILDEQFARDVPEGKGVWLEYGKDNYAGVTWSDVPESDGRRLLVGWMSNWEYADKVPTTAWRSGATLPRSLLLKNTDIGYRLLSQPVKELETLREKSFEITPGEITGSLDLSPRLGFSPGQSEMIFEFDLSQTNAGKFGIELTNSKGERYRIGYDAVNNQYYSDRTQSGDTSFSDKFAASIHTAPRFSRDKTVRLHLFFDVASAELFADDGATVMAELYFPGEIFSQANIFADGGKTTLLHGNVYQLQSIWK